MVSRLVPNSTHRAPQTRNDEADALTPLSPKGVGVRLHLDRGWVTLSSRAGPNLRRVRGGAVREKQREFLAAQQQQQPLVPPATSAAAAAAAAAAGGTGGGEGVSGTTTVSVSAHPSIYHALAPPCKTRHMYTACALTGSACGGCSLAAGLAVPRA